MRHLKLMTAALLVGATLVGAFAASAEEVTVKRWRRRGHVVQLEAENPEFKPIEVDLRNEPLVIEGIRSA